MIEREALVYLTKQRELAMDANRERNIEALVDHQRRYEIVYEFLQEVDVLPKFWNHRNPKQRP